jgi:hypothetical protein
MVALAARDRAPLGHAAALALDAYATGERDR